ncbi:MAG: radical SAM protein [Ruminococcaceae bacterium]|nr:radical SAM protein [Oscillospiraceae bacterium]
MDKFVMERSGVTVTNVCNLDCARCASYIPYHKKPVFVSVEKLTEYIEKYFSIVDFVKKFIITGGEPLLHPEIEKIVDVLLKYESQIGDLQIISNGTKVPNEKLISSFSQFKDKANFLIDNYGAGISVAIKDIDETLSKTNIRYVIRENNSEKSHCGGWIDLGDLTEKRCVTKEEAVKVYNMCAYAQKLNFCFVMSVDGIMNPCPPSKRCRELGSIEDNYDEYIDLLDESLTIEEQREKINRIYNFDSLSACAFCNGLNDYSERFVPGVQLTKEEKECVKLGANQYCEVRRMLEKNGL